VAVALALCALAGCTTIRVLPAESSPTLASDVYFYPQRGQSPAQQDRDRFDCYAWASHESGFDPSAAGPHARNARVIAAPPPNADAAVGALTGGALGAALGRSVGGAALGAIAGGLIGASSDAARAETLNRLTSAEGATSGADAYRHAMAACLAGRGYSVG
jgi:hypothetical protein